MSYNSEGGPYSYFQPLDVQALHFIYGGDGIGDSSVLTVRLQLPKQNQTLHIWCIRIWKSFIQMQWELQPTLKLLVPATILFQQQSTPLPMKCFPPLMGVQLFIGNLNYEEVTISRIGIMETFGRFHLASSELIRWKTIQNLVRQRYACT